MSEEMYNIKEELQLIKAGVVIKWVFAVIWITFMLLGLRESIGYPTTVLGDNFPFFASSIISLGIAIIIHMIVYIHKESLKRMLREERWKEHNKKHKQ